MLLSQGFCKKKLVNSNETKNRIVMGSLSAAPNNIQSSLVRRKNCSAAAAKQASKGGKLRQLIAISQRSGLAGPTDYELYGLAND